SAHVFVTRIESEISELVRIRIEIEKLGRPVDVVDILPATEPEHEHATARKDRVVLAERLAVGVGLARERHEGPPRQVGFLGRWRGAHHLEERRIYVDQHGVRADYSIDRHVRAGNDERYCHRALEHRALPPKTMLAEHLAMIRRVDHAGRTTEPTFLEGSQHDSDLFVEEADEAVVRGDGPPDGRLVERRREPELTTVQLVRWMARPLCIGPR